MHLSDGPIDLIIEAFGAQQTIIHAYDAALGRFAGLLDELCAELPALRKQADPAVARLAGPIARCMEAAVRPFAASTFITPMAAVAGSVADAVLAAMVEATGDDLERAYVNNGGDIALYLSPGQQFSTGLVARPYRPSLFATTTIGPNDRIGGIATSGVHGRSFSLGIADAVSILARTAAEADAAATIVANAVDLTGDTRIVRVPARDLQPDSDLGAIAVTRFVPQLSPLEIDTALTHGALVAEALIAQGLIAAAALHLQDTTRLVGAEHLLTSSPSSSPQGPLHA
jgi:ApbE superfamily uncharacterized protein (UPF0280 family)